MSLQNFENQIESGLNIQAMAFGPQQQVVADLEIVRLQEPISITLKKLITRLSHLIQQNNNNLGLD